MRLSVTIFVGCLVLCAGLCTAQESTPEVDIRLANGVPVEGTFSSADPEGLSIQTARGTKVLPWIYLSAGTRWRYERPMLAKLKAKRIREAKAAKAKAEAAAKAAAAKAAKAAASTNKPAAAKAAPAKAAKSKKDKAKPGATTTSTWKKDVTKASIPAELATGMAHGISFIVEKANIQNGILTLKQEKQFPVYQQFMILTFLEKNEDFNGKKFKIKSNDNLGPSVPHIHFTYTITDKNMPETEMFMKGYSMKLEFGKISGNKIPGKIYLCLPDKAKSFIAGTFEAEIK